MTSVPGARRYAAWQALVGTWFWLPVFFLYFTGELGLDGALVLEAVYYLAVVVTEVPSGYASDRLGRKPTLVLASLFLLAAYIAFFVGGSLALLVVGQVFLALGISFRSGTDTSYHFELLSAAGHQAEFAKREGRLVRLTLLVGAFGAVAGGLAGSLWLAAAYLLSIVASLVAVGLALGLVPVPVGESSASPASQLRACWRALSQPGVSPGPPLRWLFAVAVLAVVLAHVPYQLYQPYLDAVTWGDLDLPTALVSGGHAAAAMLVAAPVAVWSVTAVSRFGTRTTLLVGLILQWGVIGLLAVAVHPVIAGLLVLRGAPGALLRPALDAAVAPQLSAAVRATYLSLQSLGGRLAYAVVLALMSLVVGDASSADGVQVLASLALGAGAVALVVLASTGRGGQHRGDPPEESRS